MRGFSVKVVQNAKKGHVFLCFLTSILLGGFFFSFPEQVTFGKTGSGKCAVFVFFCDCFGLVCEEEFGKSWVVLGIRLGRRVLMRAEW